MKVVLTIEDTSRGVTVGTQVFFNGVNDGGPRSIALAAGISCGYWLDRMHSVGAINIEKVKSGPQPLLPAPRR